MTQQGHEGLVHMTKTSSPTTRAHTNDDADVYWTSTILSL